MSARKIIFVILISYIPASISLGQGCLPDGFFFTTQAQIDNFQSDYPGCTEIIGDVNIDGGGITNLEGLDVLTKIGGYLMIVDCEMLENLSGLDQLDTVQGWFELHQSNLLTDLQGLNSLKYIGGSCWIYNNEGLTSLAGLNSLQLIGGDLMLIFNGNLVSLEALGGLDQINGHLNIAANTFLPSLSGLGNISPGSISELSISYNPSLKTCEVQSVCDYLSLSGGMVNIEENGEGCMDPGQVSAACLNTGMAGVPEAARIELYPNPAKDRITVAVTGASQIKEINMYDLTGRIVDTFTGPGQLDVSMLPPGHYLVEIVTRQSTVYKKISIHE